MHKRPDTERPVTGRERTYLDRIYNELSADAADILRVVAEDVTAGIIPESGHWVMEENPASTVALITDFLN